MKLARELGLLQEFEVEYKSAVRLKSKQRIWLKKPVGFVEHNSTKIGFFSNIFNVHIIL